MTCIKVSCCWSIRPSTLDWSPLSFACMQDHTLVGASKAPALQPMLELYTDLYNKGFSVTFITGRCVSLPHPAAQHPPSPCFSAVQHLHSLKTACTACPI